MIIGNRPPQFPGTTTLLPHGRHRYVVAASCSSLSVVQRRSAQCAIRGEKVCRHLDVDYRLQAEHCRTGRDVAWRCRQSAVDRLCIRGLPLRRESETAATVWVSVTHRRCQPWRCLSTVRPTSPCPLDHSAIVAVVRSCMRVRSSVGLQCLRYLPVQTGLACSDWCVLRRFIWAFRKRGNVLVACHRDRWLQHPRRHRHRPNSDQVRQPAEYIRLHAVREATDASRRACSWSHSHKLRNTCWYVAATVRSFFRRRRTQKSAAAAARRGPYSSTVAQFRHRPIHQWSDHIRSDALTTRRPPCGIWALRHHATSIDRQACTVRYQALSSASVGSMVRR